MTHGKTIHVNTKGFSDITDLTDPVDGIIESSGIQDGMVTISSIGSTASVTTMEYEPALVEDFKAKLEQLIPSTERSRHSETWGDDNGFSHMRASLMGPSVSLPVSKGRMVRGTWQQVVFIDHDNRPRTREIFVMVVGE